jgi:hypothetical protein
MRSAPHSRFLRMGLLDCFGTFLTAMGAVHTPGQYQPILNQSLVPATMTVSAIFLGTRYTPRHVGGALFIVSGAVLSLVLRHGGAGSEQDLRLYAVFMYWLSNVPMACSAVYKEARRAHCFRSPRGAASHATVRVHAGALPRRGPDGRLLADAVGLHLPADLRLCARAAAGASRAGPALPAPSSTRALRSNLPHVPQMLPGVGTASGLPAAQIWESFSSGWSCFAQAEGSGCAPKHTALLFMRPPAARTAMQPEHLLRPPVRRPGLDARCLMLSVRAAGTCSPTLRSTRSACG